GHSQIPFSLPPGHSYFRTAAPAIRAPRLAKGNRSSSALSSHTLATTALLLPALPSSARVQLPGTTCLADRSIPLAPPPPPRPTIAPAAGASSRSPQCLL